MELSKNDYVINEMKTDWGTGKITAIDVGYVHVVFEGVDGEKIFARDDHPLRRVNEPNHNERLERRLRNTMHSGQDLIKVVERDRQNAIHAKILAEKALSSIPRIIERPDIVSGESPGLVSQLRARERELMTLRAIEHDPFDAMVEVETLNSAGKTMEQLWYANEKALLNKPLGMNAQRINILAWTHPGVQMALAGDLEEPQDLRGCGYTLVEVTPRRRAKFAEVVPEISGLYEPGGSVRPHEEETPSAGLKAVKLDMTPDQVKAFISKMDGMMLVSGAPGSGKTTVALQRVRFLLDQQELRNKLEDNVDYEEGLTKIFLANKNLYEYSRQLLVENLGIAESVVELVKDFTTNYLNSVWVYKHKAQPRRKALFHLELRARQAIFGLCSEKDLFDIWKAYETQVAKKAKDGEGEKFRPAFGTRASQTG